jgi:hypothetical protein
MRDFTIGSSNTRARWVRWAGWFCTQNVNALNSRDWVEIRHELYRFIYADVQTLEESSIALISGAANERFFEEATRDFVSQVQEHYNSFLRKLATGKKDEIFFAVTPVRAPVRPFGLGLVLFDRSSPVGFSIFGNDLEVEAHITLANHIVAGRIVLDQIRICPECNNLVIIETKPRRDRTYHCSLRCSRLAANRSYRQRKRDEIRERDKQRYQEKIRRKRVKKHGVTDSH